MQQGLKNIFDEAIWVVLNPPIVKKENKKGKKHFYISSSPIHAFLQ